MEAAVQLLIDIWKKVGVWTENFFLLQQWESSRKQWKVLSVFLPSLEEYQVYRDQILVKDSPKLYKLLLFCSETHLFPQLQKG